MMMDLPGDMPVTLVIKAPNQRMADQTVDCMLGWTIKKLKQHLETVYPSKPKHNEQRLIYSGRLLQDHLTLKEILRQYDDSELPSKHTVHLVCSTASDTSNCSSSSSSPPSKTASSNSVTSQPNTSRSSNRNNAEMAAAGQGEGLRYRGQGQPPEQPATPVTTNTYTGYPGYPMYQAGMMGGETATAYPGYPPVTPEQYAWMMHQQQLYSQYMMQYMQYYQGHYHPGQSFHPQMLQSPFMPQPVDGTTLPAQQQQQQQQQPEVAAAAAANNGGAAAAGQRQNVRMNAQGGMEEDDEDDGEPRDWLHHTYFIMRLLTFLGILFFYSNLTRFLIVFTGSFAIYVLQKIRKYMQRAQQEQEGQTEQEQNQQQQQQPEQQEQQPPPQAEQQQQNSPVETQAETTSDESTTTNTETTEENTEAEQPEDENGRVGRAVSFVWNTVQTFFTSLLPTPPELLELN